MTTANREPRRCPWVDLTKPDDFKFKEGDGPAYAVHAQTTDKILIAADNGRFYTLGCDRLPSARGHGEPIRLMIELGNEQDIVQLIILKGGRKFFVIEAAFGADQHGERFIGTQPGRLQRDAAFRVQHETLA